MGSEPQGPELRPLPGVSMPLLPAERRAARVRRWALGIGLGTLLTAGSAAGLWWKLGARPDEEGPTQRNAGLAAGHDAGAAQPAPDAHAPTVDDGPARAPALEEPTPPPALPPTAPAPDAEASGTDDTFPGPREQGGVASSASETPAARRVERRFGRQPGFRAALRALGLTGSEASALEKALRGKLDFRRCRPDDRLQLELDGEGRPVRFRYQGSSPLWFVEATRSRAGGTWRARRVERTPERRRVARAGRIETSLRAALEQAGLGASLVGLFVSVFGAKADFSTDTRKGDAFRILLDEERIDGAFLRWGTAHLLEYRGQRTGLLRAYWFAPRGGRGDYYDEEGRLIGSWLRPPLRYDHVSSRFDPRRRHPILKRIVPHTGVDFAASLGTPVWAAADGVVRFAGRKGANGNLVVLDHGNGYQSFYAHLHRIARGMRPGRRLRRGEVLGYVGSTGRSTGPHLHFALKRGGRFVDPLEVMHGPGPRLPTGQLRRFRRQARSLRGELDRRAPPP